ncbi:SMP-30/gluconolactonase/LRE family protein [Chitinophaga sp. SYP-B3965]|uniref:SMP-30/gluconolactonase/LRE family protein n=1 Tax=Chitinophaga sp. SYP-B3965 TaxID=2663120 RepID=UPI001299E872|nr:SMP-30/gluconolactonase/LRE family protein [Chitinophaga sp. SYP-B3965]MRG48576.1 SMP-30/gluconolactonase/LRE family protein [Chitinophaga sp. SYP-B3965]
MKIIITLLLSTLAAYSYGQQNPDLVADNAQPVLVSKQFSFTEGPAPDKQGNVFFTDQPNNQIWKYSTDGKLSLFLDSAGRSNGLYFDKKGNLIACADDKNEMWSISPSGKVTVLMTDYQGRKFNGPNDLWITPKGGIYFTDPYYQRKYWERKKPDLDSQRVYFLAPGKRQAIMVADNIKKPNGIAGTKDGKTLYVADIGDNKIYKYKINKDATLSDAQLFANKGGDGMTVDEKGNVYICGNGITVFNPKGEEILHIAVPEKWTANLCFGGKDRKTLFITASETVYTLQMKVKGVE